MKSARKIERYRSILCCWRNGKPVARAAPSRSGRGGTRSRCPLRNAPAPASAAKRSFLTGSHTTPASRAPRRPPRVRAIETAQCGKPRTKFAVPSSGSTIHEGAVSSAPVSPVSSPRKRSTGNAPRRTRRMTASLSRSAIETTSFFDFSSTRAGSSRPKCPRRTSPASRAAAIAASIGRMPLNGTRAARPPPPSSRTRPGPAPIRGSARRSRPTPRGRARELPAPQRARRATGGSPARPGAAPRETSRRENGPPRRRFAPGSRTDCAGRAREAPEAPSAGDTPRAKGRVRPRETSPCAGSRPRSAARPPRRDRRAFRAAAHLHPEDREEDRHSLAALEERAEEDVAWVVIIVLVADESQLLEENAREKPRLLERGARPGRALSHDGRGRVEDRLGRAASGGRRALDREQRSDEIVAAHGIEEFGEIPFVLARPEFSHRASRIPF